MENVWPDNDPMDTHPNRNQGRPDDQEERNQKLNRKLLWLSLAIIAGLAYEYFIKSL